MCITETLHLWNFLHCFHSQLKLTRLTLNDLVEVLAYDRPNAVLAEICCALLRVLLSDSRFKRKFHRKRGVDFDYDVAVATGVGLGAGPDASHDVTPPYHAAHRSVLFACIITTQNKTIAQVQFDQS